MILKKILIYTAIGLVLTGCIKNPLPESSENHFNMNGKDIVLSDEELEEFRGHWKGDNAIKVSTLLTKEDVQWILDFISIREYVLNHDCKKLVLLENRVFDHNIDVDNVGPHIKAGKFEYMWRVDACSVEHKYRIVNEEGSSDFLVYPLSR